MKRWPVTRRSGGRLAVLLLTLAACLGDSDTALGPFPGRALGLRLERIVAIGDGFLAGEQDGALYRGGQDLSIPALFAAHAGVTDFAQPLISDPGLATVSESGGRLTLVSTQPPVIERTTTSGVLLDPDRPGPYNNLSVPGALLSEAPTAQSLGTSIQGNQFYDVVLRGRGTFTEQAIELDATFVLLWLGTNDVLTYARAGGHFALAPGLPTPEATFALIYEDILDQLLGLTDQIAVFNIPDVTQLPFLNTIPPVAINPATGEPFTITVLERVVDPVTGDTLSVQRQVPVPLLGPGGPLASSDLVSLEAQPLIDLGVGVPIQQGGLGVPLFDRFVLDRDEQTLARDAITGYNAIIERLAGEHGLALVDVRSVTDAIHDRGLITDGVLLTEEFVTGQGYSLDGTHFTPKAYGVITNRLLEAVNARYGSRLPAIRTSDLPGVPLISLP